MSFRPDPGKIRKMHRLYFGEEPTAVQVALYDGFPLACGFSDEQQDAEMFRAVLHLALMQTIPENGEIEKSGTTFVFFPHNIESWVVEQIRANAEVIFERLRVQKRVEAARFLGASFLALRLGHLILQVPGVPERWVSYGFTREGSIPKWMQGRLIDPSI